MPAGTPREEVQRPKPVAKAIETRPLDVTTHDELCAAWTDNPLAAREKYKDTRVRLVARVLEVGSSPYDDFGRVRVHLRPTPATIVYDVKDNPGGRFVAGLSFETSFLLAKGDCLRLSRNKTYAFEASVREYDFTDRLRDSGVEFGAVRFEGEAPSPVAEMIDPKKPAKKP